MVRYIVVLALAIGVCLPAGCARRKGPKREPTFPVSGVIKIDGTPTPMVRVFMFPEDKLPEWFEPLRGAPHFATTDNDGKFKISTYESGDGAPAGKYVVCFYWEGNPKVLPFSNPDEPPVDPTAAKFNKKYGQPHQSQIKVTVEKGKATDMGTLDLTTK
jgi:hypothetical protein